MIRVLHVVGARPNFMKTAALHHALGAEPDVFEQVLVHTGQHYDARLSEVFFGDLRLPAPDVNLGVGSATHARQIADIMLRFEPVLDRYQPDLVVVVGDVNSTFACALAADIARVPVAHVEAGLRSYDADMPEERNRRLTDHLAAFLFTPSRDADANLAREGITRGVHLVGNVMIDTLLTCLPEADAKWQAVPEWHGVEYVLVTLHRPSNVDDPLRLQALMHALMAVAAIRPVLFSVHPRTRAKLRDAGLEAGNVRLLDPLPYLDFLALEAHARAVVTDSGGVQEETTFLNVPCFTLRGNTERPVTVSEGTNRLILDLQDLVPQVLACFDRQPDPSRRPPELWDGRAATRIAQLLKEQLAQGPK